MEPFKRIEPTAISTIGQLRQVIADLPDNELIFWQACAEDGSAWSMQAQAGHARSGTIFCIGLHHPELKTLKFGGGDALKMVEFYRKVRAAVDEVRAGS